MLESRLLLGIIMCVCMTANAAVRIVVPFVPGGPADNLARTIQVSLAQELAQPVAIEYRQGAGGDVAAAYVANTDSKDVVLLLTSTGIVTNLLLKSNQYYDATRLVPVSYIGTQTLILAVGNKSAMRNFAEWRKTANSATYGSSGVGSATHIVGEVFARTIDRDLQHIPYKGIAQATTDVISGTLDFMFDYDTHALPFVQDQQLIAIAVAAPHRLARLPDVPTLRELGITGMDIQPWWAIFANQTADAADLMRTQAALTKVLKNTADYQRLGIEIKDTKISRDFLQQEQQHYSRIVKRINIHLE